MDQSLYDILGVSPTADEAAVKAAFRRLALALHPDTNPDSETATAFVLVHNAYRTLLDPVRRRDYDEFEGRHRQAPCRPQAPVPRPAPRLPASHRDRFDNKLNTLLWDLEDLLTRARHGRPPANLDLKSWERDILRVLSFWDKWVLEPGGAPDYFLTARKAPALDPRTWEAGFGRPGGHSPHTSVENYFFEVRKRLNRVLETLDRADWLAPVGETGVPWIEGLLEAQDRAVHTVSALERVWAGTQTQVPPFVPHRPELDWW